MKCLTYNFLDLPLASGAPHVAQNAGVFCAGVAGRSQDILTDAQPEAHQPFFTKDSNRSLPAESPKTPKETVPVFSPPEPKAPEVAEVAATMVEEQAPTTPSLTARESPEPSRGKSPTYWKLRGLIRRLLGGVPL